MYQNQQRRCHYDVKFSALKTSIILLVIFQLFTSSPVASQTSLYQLNSSTLHKLYYSTLQPNQSLIITNTNHNNHTLNSIQALLATTNFRNAKSIQLTNLNYLFKPCRNQSLPACRLDELFFSTESNQTNLSNTFQLDSLNLTNNHLTESFLEVAGNHSDIYLRLVYSYFSHLRLLVLSNNKFKHLERKHLFLFHQHGQLETLLVNSNKISSIRHDTFHDLARLKHLDLSNNHLKLIHPLTFCVQNSQLTLLNLRNNRLRTLFYTPIFKQTINVTNTTTDPIINNSSLPNLSFLYLEGNEDFTCNCGLLWLYHAQKTVTLDNFTCSYTTNHTLVSHTVPFQSISNESLLEHACTDPGLYVDTDSLAQTSSFTLFRSWATRWFDWTLLVDISQEKHVFHTWRTSDVVFDCTNKDPSADVDETNSTIIWKTQHGYLR